MNKYTQVYHITNGEMDINYRLKPISVIMYFQDCFARYMTLKNLAAFDIIRKNLYWVVSEFNIDFLEELPFWSEKIEVTTWLSEISKLRMYMDFELKHNGKIFAKGNSCWYILSSETRRPVVTDIASNVLEVCEELTIGEHKKFNIGEIQEKTKEISHKINMSDIDFNNHVNNKSYLMLAQSNIPDEFKNTHTIKKLSVKFIQEAFLDDILVCSTYTTDSENSFVHRITRDGVNVCDIKTSWEKTGIQNSISDINLDVRNLQVV